MPKLRSLEMLRAVAALLVVMFHIQVIFSTHTGTPPFAGTFSSAFRGLDLFFVLSGFIVAYVHASDVGRPGRLGNYAFNRTMRIYPAVWVMTILAIGLYAAGFGGTAKADKLAGWSITASMLLLPQAGDALVNVTWSLKYEVFFYLVFGIMIWNKKIGLGLLCAWQLAVVAAVACLPPDAFGLGGFYLRSRCLEFGVGVICAWLSSRPNCIRATRGAWLQWGLLFGGIASFTGGMLLETITTSAGVPCVLGAGAIIVGLIRLEQSARIRIPQVLVFLGGASYSIYLVHFSAMTVLAEILRRSHALPINDFVFAAVAVFGVISGVVFDLTVDQPVQRLLRRKLKPALLGPKPYILSPSH